MPETWQNFGDVLGNSLAAAQQIQAIQANQMAMAQAQEEARRRAAFSQWLSGGQGSPVPGILEPQQGMAPGMGPGMGPDAGPAPLLPEQAPIMPQPGQQAMPQPQQAPVIDPAQAQLLRGQRKVSSLAPMVSEAFKTDPVNVTRINKLSSIVNNDEDVKAAVKSMGFESVDFGYDEKQGRAWQRFTKNWTREELDKLAQGLQGGSVLNGLPEGKYTLEYDPVNKRLLPAVQSVDDTLGKKSESELIDIAKNSKDQGKRDAAQKILDEMQSRKLAEAKVRQMATAGTSGLTADALEAQAERYLSTGVMPPLGMGKDAASTRVAILNRAEELARARGIDMPQQIGAQTELAASRKSYTKMKQLNDADIRYAEELYTDINRLKSGGLIERIRGNAPRMLNMTRRKLRDAIASKQFLGDELVLAQELDGIMNEFARISLGTTDSIADLSEGSKARYLDMIDMDRPAFALIRQLDQIKKSTEDRLAARARVLGRLEEQISRGIGTKKTEPSGGRFKILAVE